MKLNATIIKDYRKHYGVTQGMLAKKLGVTQSYIAHIEKEKYDVPEHFAEELQITRELIQTMHDVKVQRMALFPDYC